jgi:histone deacetylase 1/2
VQNYILGFKSSKLARFSSYIAKEILLYVDDIIVASSTSEATSTLLRDLNKEFVLKDLGELHYFLGFEVKKLRDGITLAQEKVCRRFIKKSGNI